MQCFDFIRPAASMEKTFFSYFRHSDSFLGTEFKWPRNFQVCHYFFTIFWPIKTHHAKLWSESKDGSMKNTWNCIPPFKKGSFFLPLLTIPNNFWNFFSEENSWYQLNRSKFIPGSWFKEMISNVKKHTWSLENWAKIRLYGKCMPMINICPTKM